MTNMFSREKNEFVIRPLTMINNMVLNVVCAHKTNKNVLECSTFSKGGRCCSKRFSPRYKLPLGRLE